MVVESARPGIGGRGEGAPAPRTPRPRAPPPPNPPPTPQRRVRRVFVRRRQERYRVARDVLGEHLAVAIGDDAAGRRQRDRPQAVRLRLQLVLRVLEDLRAKEHHHERGHRHPHHHPHQPQPAVEQVRVERAHASLSRTAMRRPTSHSTITPVTAVVRLWIGDQTSNSHPSIPPLSFPETTATARLRHQVPAKNRQPFTNKFSAKKTALLQEERYPTSVWASAPAPNEAGVRASRTSPTTNPAAALGPGRARMV